MIEGVSDKLSCAARYYQLAEECTELAQAALKMGRILDGENPTPLTESEILPRIIEEWTDVNVAAEALGLQVDEAMRAAKIERWRDRLEKREVD